MQSHSLLQMLPALDEDMIQRGRRPIATAQGTRGASPIAFGFAPPVCLHAQTLRSGIPKQMAAGVADHRAQIASILRHGAGSASADAHDALTRPSAATLRLEPIRVVAMIRIARHVIGANAVTYV